MAREWYKEVHQLFSFVLSHLSFTLTMTCSITHSNSFECWIIQETSAIRTASSLEFTNLVFESNPLRLYNFCFESSLSRSRPFRNGGTHSIPSAY